MSLTSDRNDPRLTHGTDSEPGPMAEVYLVLSDEERAKGFVRPVRRSYRHVGAPGPRYELRDLTPEEHERYDRFGYVRYEPYPEGSAALGQYWTQERLDGAGKACRAVTTMGVALAETYARNPAFYGATFCAGCSMHRPVGVQGEFIWVDDAGYDTSNLVGT